jgi:hypothetical protein
VKDVNTTTVDSIETIERATRAYRGALAQWMNAGASDFKENAGAELSRRARLIKERYGRLGTEMIERETYAAFNRRAR